MGVSMAGATVLGAAGTIAGLSGCTSNHGQAGGNASPADDPGASTVNIDRPVVYEGPDVIFRQLDEHLWVGNGHRCYNESVYIVEGDEKSLLIDAGMSMPDLDRIVAGITDKPVELALTHNHGDHVGAVNCFPSVWMAEGASPVRGYDGEVKYMHNHQVFDLGGRFIEVLFTPGHTTDSVAFIDSAGHYAISGDAFGSTNLLMTCPLSTFIHTAEEMLEVMCRQRIYLMYPGHYAGDNAETTKRVYDLLTVARDVRDGRKVGQETGAGLGGINRQVVYEGVRFNYNDRLISE